MQPSLLIAVCTCRRPDLLRRCLRSILAQLPAQDGAVQLAVIDNDPAGSARTVVTEEGAASGRPVPYAAEPRNGIPHARNRAAKVCAEAGAGWLVFIDDDSLAGPEWLDALLWAIREYPADVIAGPVDKPLPAPAPFWALPRRPEAHDEGSHRPVARTNNVAIRSAVFREPLRLRFDTQMRHTGGSDTDFFRRLVAAGGTIRWSNRPRVSEPVPPGRLTFRWQMARKFRTACNDIHIYRRLRPVVPLYARRGLRALWFLAGGGMLLAGAMILLPLAPQRFKKPALAGGQQLFWALGTLAAMMGHSATPYRPGRISGQ
jgi:succinoglycan biosynthesis protein ExoM